MQAQEIINQIRALPGARLTSGPFIRGAMMNPARVVLWLDRDADHPKLVLHYECLADDGTTYLTDGEYFDVFEPARLNEVVGRALEQFSRRCVQHIEGTLPSIASAIGRESALDGKKIFYHEE